jgi:hypothetical protein
MLTTAALPRKIPWIFESFQKRQYEFDKNRFFPVSSRTTLAPALPAFSFPVRGGCIPPNSGACTEMLGENN